MCGVSHPWLFSHLPFTTSTRSSSFTLPSTTQEHAAQSVPQEQLREHPAHHAHIKAPSVDKLRHQESLWREDLQSGGNPRTTTPTFLSVTVSQHLNNLHCLNCQNEVPSDSSDPQVTTFVSQFSQFSQFVVALSSQLKSWGRSPGQLVALSSHPYCFGCYLRALRRTAGQDVYVHAVARRSFSK